MAVHGYKYSTTRFRIITDPMCKQLSPIFTYFHRLLVVALRLKLHYIRCCICSIITCLVTSSNT
uniref:Uncharacterized protein n=1 Tax=Arundo donax TaxID=35708 RepID=A0A0A9D4T3_ARUDO